MRHSCTMARRSAFETTASPTERPHFWVGGMRLPLMLERTHASQSARRAAHGPCQGKNEENTAMRH